MKILLALIALLMVAFSSSAADINITNVTHAASVPPGSYLLGTTGSVTRLISTSLLGGGSQVWTNDGTFIRPSGGQSSTNFLKFVSGAADAPSNAAFTIDTAVPWTGDTNKLLVLKNGGTNVAYWSENGGIVIANSPEPYWYPNNLDFFTALHDVSKGDASPGIFQMGSVDDANNQTNTAYFDISVDQNTATGSAFMEAKYISGSHDLEYTLALGPQHAELTLYCETDTSLDIWPTANDGVLPYKFSTSKTHTGGNLMSVMNNKTNKFCVDWSGAIVLAGTTNQITFGATNTNPVSAAAPVKWISVSVTGETNEYRLPLYE